jgi:hypothetical protein
LWSGAEEQVSRLAFAVLYKGTCFLPSGAEEYTQQRIGVVKKKSATCLDCYCVLVVSCNSWRSRGSDEMSLNNLTSSSAVDEVLRIKESTDTLFCLLNALAFRCDRADLKQTLFRLSHR